MQTKDDIDITTIHDFDGDGENKQHHSHAVLVMIYGEFLGKRFVIKDQPVVIGRSAESNICLNDDGISRSHCRVITNDKVVMLVDLGSTNGTYVNNTAVSARPLKDGDRIKIGSTIFKFLSSGNVEQSYHEEIYRLKTTDGLTGAYNKHYFDEEMERELARFHRYGRPMSLAMLDLDHFKQINDKYGHLAGDAVLAKFAAVVTSTIRREDTFARYGGEEFALFMPEIDLPDAAGIAQRIRELVESSIFEFEGKKIPVTVSVGVADVQPTIQTVDDLVRIADERLYEAKHAGRNCVRPVY